MNIFGFNVTILHFLYVVNPDRTIAYFMTITTHRTEPYKQSTCVLNVTTPPPKKTPFIKRFQPDLIILMVGGNDGRGLNSPEELACKLLVVVSVLHKWCSVSHIHACKLLPRFWQSFDYNLSMQPMLL